MNETEEINECYNIIDQLEKMRDNHLSINLLKTIIRKYPETRTSILEYNIFDNLHWTTVTYRSHSILFKVR